MHTAKRCSIRAQRKQAAEQASNEDIAKHQSNKVSKNMSVAYRTKLINSHEEENAKAYNDNKLNNENDPNKQNTTEVWEKLSGIPHYDDNSNTFFHFNFEDYMINEDNNLLECNTLSDVQYNLWNSVDRVLEASREWECRDNSLRNSENNMNVLTNNQIKSITNIINSKFDNSKCSNKETTNFTKRKEQTNESKPTISLLEKFSNRNNIVNKNNMYKDNINTSNLCNSVTTFNTIQNSTESATNNNNSNNTNTNSIKALESKIKHARMRLHCVPEEHRSNPLHKSHQEKVKSAHFPLENNIENDLLIHNDDSLTQSTCTMSSSSSSSSFSLGEEQKSFTYATQDGVKYNYKRSTEKTNNMTANALDNDWFAVFGIIDNNNNNSNDDDNVEEITIRTKQINRKIITSKSQRAWEFDPEKYAMELLCDCSSSVGNFRHEYVDAENSELNVTAASKTKTTHAFQKDYKANNNNNNNNDANSNNDSNSIDNSESLFSEIVVSYAKLLNKDIEQLKEMNEESNVQTKWPSLLNEMQLCGYSASEIHELLKSSINYIHQGKQTVKQKESYDNNINSDPEVENSIKNNNTVKIERKANTELLSETHSDKEHNEEIMILNKNNNLTKTLRHKIKRDNNDDDNDDNNNSKAAYCYVHEALIQELKECRDVHVQEVFTNKLLNKLSTVPVELSTELTRQRRLIEHLIEIQHESMRRVKNAEKSVSVMNTKLFPSSALRSTHHSASIENNNNNINLNNNNNNNNNRNVSTKVNKWQKDRQVNVANELYSELVAERKTNAKEDINDEATNSQVKLCNLEPMPISLHTSKTLEEEQHELQEEQYQQEQIARREEIEARYYLKELYRVSDDYKEMLHDEKEKRRAERRAFGELLKQQQVQLLAQHKQELSQLVKERKLQKVQSELLVQKLLHVTQDKMERVVSDNAAQNRKDIQLMMKGAVDKIESHLTQPTSSLSKQRCCLSQSSSPYKPIRHDKTKTSKRVVWKDGKESNDVNSLQVQGTNMLKDLNNTEKTVAVEANHPSFVNDTNNISANKQTASEEEKEEDENDKVSHERNLSNKDEDDIEKNNNSDEINNVSSTLCKKSVEEQSKIKIKQKSATQQRTTRANREMQMQRIKRVYSTPRKTTSSRPTSLPNLREKDNIRQIQLEREMKLSSQNKLFYYLNNNSNDNDINDNVDNKYTMQFIAQETIPLSTNKLFANNDDNYDNFEEEEEESRHSHNFEEKQMYFASKYDDATMSYQNRRYCNNDDDDDDNDDDDAVSSTSKYKSYKFAKSNTFVGRTVLFITTGSAKQEATQGKFHKSEILLEQQQQKEEEKEQLEELQRNAVDKSVNNTYQLQWQEYTKIITQISKLLHEIENEKWAYNHRNAEHSQNIATTTMTAGTTTKEYILSKTEANDSANAKGNKINNINNKERFLNALTKVTPVNNFNHHNEQLNISQEQESKETCKDAEITLDAHMKRSKLQKANSQTLSNKEEELHQAQLRLHALQRIMFNGYCGNICTNANRSKYTDSALFNESVLYSNKTNNNNNNSTNISSRQTNLSMTNIKSEVTHSTIDDIKVEKITRSVISSIKEELINKWLHSHFDTNNVFTNTANVVDYAVANVKDEKKGSKKEVENSEVQEPETDKVKANEMLASNIKEANKIHLRSTEQTRKQAHNVINEQIREREEKDMEQIALDSLEEIVEQQLLEGNNAQSTEVTKLSEPHMQQSEKEEQLQEERIINYKKSNNVDGEKKVDELVNKRNTVTDLFAQMDRLHSDYTSVKLLDGHADVEVIERNNNDNSFFLPITKYKTVLDDTQENVASESFKPLRPAWVHDNVNDTDNNYNSDNNNNKVVSAQQIFIPRTTTSSSSPSSYAASRANPITVQVIKHRKGFEVIPIFNERQTHQIQKHETQKYKEKQLDMEEREQQNKTTEEQENETNIDQQHTSFKPLRPRTNLFHDKDEIHDEYEEEYNTNRKINYPYSPLPPLQIFIDVGKLVNPEWSSSLSTLPISKQRLELEDEVQSHQLLIKGCERGILQEESRRFCNNDHSNEEEEILDDVIVERVEEIIPPNILDSNIVSVKGTTTTTTTSREHLQSEQLATQERLSESENRNSAYPHKQVEEQQSTMPTWLKTSYVNHDNPHTSLFKFAEYLIFMEAQERFTLCQVAEVEYNNLMALHDMTFKPLPTLTTFANREQHIEQSEHTMQSSHKLQRTAVQVDDAKMDANVSTQHETKQEHYYEEPPHLQEEKEEEQRQQQQEEQEEESSKIHNLIFEVNDNNATKQFPHSRINFTTSTNVTSTELTIPQPRDPVLHFVFQWLKEKGEEEAAELDKSCNSHSNNVKENDTNHTLHTSANSQVCKPSETTQVDHKQHVHYILEGLRRANRLATTFESDLYNPTLSTSTSTSTSTMEHESSSEFTPSRESTSAVEYMSRHKTEELDKNTFSGSSNIAFSEQLNEMEFADAFQATSSSHSRSTSLTSTLSTTTVASSSDVSLPKHKPLSSYAAFAKNKCRFMNSNKYNYSKNNKPWKRRVAPVISLSSSTIDTIEDDGRESSSGNRYENKHVKHSIFHREHHHKDSTEIETETEATTTTTTTTTRSSSTTVEQDDNVAKCNMSPLQQSSESTNTTRYTFTPHSSLSPDEDYEASSNDVKIGNECENDKDHLNEFETHSYLHFHHSRHCHSNVNSRTYTNGELCTPNEEENDYIEKEDLYSDNKNDDKDDVSTTATTRATTTTTTIESDEELDERFEKPLNNNIVMSTAQHKTPKASTTTLISPALNEGEETNTNDADDITMKRSGDEQSSLITTTNTWDAERHEKEQFQLPSPSPSRSWWERERK